MCPGCFIRQKSQIFDLMDVENMNNVNSSSADCSPQSLRMEGRCWLIMLRLLLECLEASLHEPAREIKKTGRSLLSTASAGGEALLTTWWMLDNIFLCLISPQKLVLYRYLDFGSIYRLLRCVERWYFMDGVLISSVKIGSLCLVSSYFISCNTSVLKSLL